MSIEGKVKNQYSKVFLKGDWRDFKTVADFYFESAAKLKKKDVRVRPPYKLMVRNIQKRLFIGIGTELLLKSLYLKHNYCINKPHRNLGLSNFPMIFDDINLEDYNPNETFTLGILVDKVKDILISEYPARLDKGLRIAKVFRNKEGHVTTLFHEFDPDNYSDIEFSIFEIYKLGFQENLVFQVSFEKNEKAEFKID